MAARKRKIAQPKRAAEPEALADVAETAASETAASETSEAPDLAATAKNAVPEHAEAAESIVPPPESGESDAMTLKPPPPNLEKASDSAADDSSFEGQALMGEGSSLVDESRIDDTGAYIKGLLEALLFVSDHPLEIKDLARAAKIDKKRAEELVQELRAEYEHRGVRLDEIGDGYGFRSNPTYSEYVRGY
ncbi:MAG TPA: SMC-Scp complex subunit ScpB, partial [Polyangiaceae bacterium]